jgi:hypothetical protein
MHCAKAVDASEARASGKARTNDLKRDTIPM